MNFWSNLFLFMCRDGKIIIYFLPSVKKILLVTKMKTTLQSNNILPVFVNSYSNARILFLAGKLIAVNYRYPEPKIVN